MEHQSTVDLSVVIPVYNSEESLTPLVERLVATLQPQYEDFEIILIDDCSKDASWSVLVDIGERFQQHVRTIRLLVNHGQHNAILCGFEHARGRMIVTMDDDLQNRPEDIPSLLAELGQGADVVIGSYTKKQHQSARNFFGNIIDFTLRKTFLLPAHIQLTSFRALHRSVVDQVIGMNNSSFPYVTAMILSNASRVVNVPVTHDQRKFGTSNYTLLKSTRLALNLILHYSNLPLVLIGSIAGLATIFSCCIGLWAGCKALFWGVGIAGWASTLIIIVFFNALILLCQLVICFYVSRFHFASTQTPRSFKIAEKR